MIRLLNNDLGRLLHHQLYKRMIEFSLEFTPEFPAEPAVKFWLNEFYNGNLNYHILVDLDDKYNIKAHCLIIVAEVFNFKAAQCYQIKDDLKSKTFFEQCIEYLDKLDVQVKIFSVSKNNKVYQEKYGFTPLRQVMYKTSVEE